MVRCWYLLVKSCMQSALSLFGTTCCFVPPMSSKGPPEVPYGPEGTLGAAGITGPPGAAGLRASLLDKPHDLPFLGSTLVHWQRPQVPSWKKTSLQVNCRQTLYLFGSSYGPDGTPGVGGAGLGLGAWIFSADLERRKPASSMTQLRSTLMYRRKRPQIFHRLLALIGDSTPLPSLILWELDKLQFTQSLCHSGELRVSGEYQNTKTSPMLVTSFCHCDSLRARWNPWCSRQHRTRWSRP